MPKRKQVEDYLLENMSVLDPSGTNTARLKNMFDKMSDKEFDDMMCSVRDGNDKLAVIYTPALKVYLRMENIFRVAKKIGLKIIEKLFLNDESTGRRYKTPHEYMVIRVPVRRLKQVIMDKISVPDSDTKVDTFTGQVVKPDKGSSISSIEAQTILSKNLTTSIYELTNVRGGNITQFANFKSQLQETGSASLSVLDPTARVKSSIILSVYLRCMLIDNNLSD